MLPGTWDVESGGEDWICHSVMGCLALGSVSEREEGGVYAILQPAEMSLKICSFPEALKIFA